MCAEHARVAFPRREEDLQILQAALAQEAEQEAAEQAAHERKRFEMVSYRKQLQAMLQKEEEDNAARDRAIQEVGCARCCQ
jgi:hypothetical protein